MWSTYRVGTGLAVAAVGWGLPTRPEMPGRAAEAPAPVTRPAPLPDDTALAAVIRANGGRVPATGDQLWTSLRRVGTFAQLPVTFSAVHLTSGLTAPRVVIAPTGPDPSRADPTKTHLDGRLFLAANMDRHTGGDPRVTTVEFISWTPSRRRFDFGVIEGMGGTGEPRLTVLDAGRCFACHRNRGPILGVRPWSNTAHDDVLRLATAAGLRVSGTGLPQTGPFAPPWARPGVPAPRDRIDGMALAAPEAAAVDAAVRRGAALRTGRDAFRLLGRTPEGRKALLVLLTAVTDPGPIDPVGPKVKAALDTALAPGFARFAAEWVDLHRAAKSGALVDPDPDTLVTASRVRRPGPGGTLLSGPTFAVPGLTGGNGSRWTAPPGWNWGNFTSPPPPLPSSPSPPPRSPAPTGGYSSPRLAPAPAGRDWSRQEDRAKLTVSAVTTTLAELTRYEAARTGGAHGLVSRFQPSNLRAFLPPQVARPSRASEAVTPALFAATVGLSDGDRRFLARSLADAAARVKQAKVTPAVLAKGVFEGPRFADVLAGGPLPDRDEFKDRFVAGLDGLLTTGYGQAVGFAPDRRTYASGPRYEATDELEAAVVPTSACLRCHEVSGSAKAVRFDPIPPLAFDPFDPAGREAWLRAADPRRKREVLTRMVERLDTDADMPPEDAPEHDRFRVREAAAFDAVVRVLAAELDRVTGR